VKVSALGLRLTVRAGRTLPAPLPGVLTARLRSVDVTENDKGPSVFTLTFDAGRSGGDGALDVAGLRDSPVTVFSRVLVIVTFGIQSAVLIDGVVTELTLTPGAVPGAASLTVTGEDVSFLLDREERTAEHPAQSADEQATAILKPYGIQGIASDVVKPKVVHRPSPREWVPTQQGSDLDHLVELAMWNDCVAYVVPGPVTGTTTSTFYWGPPVRTGPAQPVLSVDLGPETTFSQVRFRTEALSPALISGDVLDGRTGKPIHLDIPGSSRAALSARPLMQTYAPDIRRRLLRGTWCQPVLAGARAQADTDRSSDAVSAEGTVDGARYGHVLRPRALVDVRGAGWSHDGSWYVQQVAHSLHRGSYQQQVTLLREGHGATTLRLPLGEAE
jgi:hypothetical protein